MVGTHCVHGRVQGRHKPRPSTQPINTGIQMPGARFTKYFKINLGKT